MPAVNIKNEAGTAIICTGQTNSAQAPVVVTGLNAPGSLAVHSEYQVSVGGANYVGRMCTALNVAERTATFQ